MDDSEPSPDTTTPPPEAAAAREILSPADWRIVIEAVESGGCTPFIGAGASSPHVELGSQIAQRWATEEDYPFHDRGNLPSVAQYLTTGAMLVSPQRPKRRMIEYLRTRPRPDFRNAGEPYPIIADLPLPIFITTNYDPFITEALRAAGKTPRREYCRWNETLRERDRERRRQAKDKPSLNQTLDATVATPLVYHLHGLDDEPDSLVLTEDDYIDFVANASKYDLVPPYIRAAMTTNLLLFLGYALSDWNFKVLFRTLTEFIEKGQQPQHVAIQLPPDGLSPEQVQRATQFADKYFARWNITIIRCDIRTFLAALNAERRPKKDSSG